MGFFFLAVTMAGLRHPEQFHSTNIVYNREQLQVTED
jgi:hypothetical protein